MNHIRKSALFFLRRCALGDVRTAQIGECDGSCRSFVGSLAKGLKMKQGTDLYRLVL
jgi:hypothetical protein